MDDWIWAYLFGAFLIVPGLGHVAGITSMGNRLFDALRLLGLIGFTIGGLAWLGFWAPHIRWRLLTVASAVLSIVLLVLFWTSISSGPQVPAFLGKMRIQIVPPLVPPRLDTSWTLPEADPNRILDAYRSWHADESESTPGPPVVQRLLDNSDQNTDQNKTPVGDEGPLVSPHGPSWRTPQYYLQSQPTAEQARRAADLQRMQPKADVIDISVPWFVTPITPDVVVSVQQIRGLEVPLRATREIVLPEVSIENALGTVRR